MRFFSFIVRMREKGGCVSFLGREIEDVKKKVCVSDFEGEKRKKLCFIDLGPSKWKKWRR